MKLIKKQLNRKYYLSGHGCYLNLIDINSLVLNNESFKVIDVKTNKDITLITKLDASYKYNRKVLLDILNR